VKVSVIEEKRKGTRMGKQKEKMSVVNEEEGRRKD